MNLLGRSDIVAGENAGLVTAIGRAPEPAVLAALRHCVYTATLELQLINLLRLVGVESNVGGWQL